MSPQSLCANWENRAGWYLVQATSIIYSSFKNINASVSIFVAISLFLPTSLPTLAVPEFHNSHTDSLLSFSLHVFVASLQKFVLMTTFPVALSSLSLFLLWILLFYSQRLVTLFLSLCSPGLNQLWVVEKNTHSKWNPQSSKQLSWCLNLTLLEQTASSKSLKPQSSCETSQFYIFESDIAPFRLSEAVVTFIELIGALSPDTSAIRSSSSVENIISLQKYEEFTG